MILARYILKEHLAPFLASFFVITFLFAVNFILRILDSVLSKGLPLGVLLEILVLNLAWMLALSIPMSCLVSTLMAYGRLSADHESTAMKSAGISPIRSMKPVIYAGFFIMVGLVAFNNYLLPEANHRAGSLLSSISRKKPQAFINSGQLIKDFPGVQIWVDKIDNESGKLFGIQIFETQQREAPKIIYADSGFIEYKDLGATLLLHLESGWNHVLDKNPEKYFRIGFFNQTFSLRNVDDRLERKERKYRGDREMNVEEMSEVVVKAKKNYEKIRNDNLQSVFKEQDHLISLLKADTMLLDSFAKDFSLKEVGVGTFSGLIRSEKQTLARMKKVARRLAFEQKREAQYRVEIHKKFSIPLACVIFCLVGAPLGMLARAGGIGPGAVLSIAFFVVYWICLITGEQFAEKLVIEPWLSMWIANIIVGMGGILLTYAMVKDKIQSLAFIKSFFGLFKNLFLWLPKGKN
jgi:lipopolysaccharide export system permease protein